MNATLAGAIVAALLVVLVVVKSVHRIGPSEVGLVTKKLAFRKLHGDNPIAFRGEAGYQAEMLMPGLRFRFWPVFSVDRHPWVQVLAGEIGVVIAQVGAPLPIAAKSARYRSSFGDFGDLAAFLEDPARGAGHGVPGGQRVPGRLRRRDPGRLHPGRGVPRGAGAGAHPPRDRQPGAHQLRRAGAGRDRPRRGREGPGHRRHAGRAGGRAGVGRHQHQPGAAREAAANGEAAYVRLTGQAEADRTQALGLAEARATEALGLARAAGYEAQRDAIGEMATALVAVAGAVAEGHIDIMPDVLVTGGGAGAVDGLAGTLMNVLRSGGGNGSGGGAAAPAAPALTDGVPTPGEAEESGSVA